MNYRICFPALLLLVSLSACKVYPPEYRRVENWKLQSLGQGKGLELYTEAVCYNPNKLKFTLQDINVYVLIEGKQASGIAQTLPVAIGKKSEFRIPLTIAITPEGTLRENLESIYNMISKKEADVALIGKVKVKGYGFTFNIPVNETQKVDLDLFKQK